MPDGDGQIFRRWDAGEELGNLFIEEAVVHRIEHFPVHDFLKFFGIDDEAGATINVAFDGDFERVVVAVAVRVIALAEQAKVFFRSEIRVVVVMRGGEFGFTRQINHARIDDLLFSIC